MRTGATAVRDGITTRDIAGRCPTRIATLRTALMADGVVCALRNYPRTSEIFGRPVRRVAPAVLRGIPA
jgi:hypothetical protein